MSQMIDTPQLPLVTQHYQIVHHSQLNCLPCLLRNLQRLLDYPVAERYQF